MTINQKQAEIWQKISKASIYLLVFLLPLFFLPFTVNVLDFNKQILLVSLVFVSLFCWLLQSLIKEKISVNIGFFNLPIIFFLVVIGLSTLFSANRYASFWGWPLTIAPSFLTSVSLVLLYFLILNIFRDKKEISGLLLVLIASGFLVAVLSLPQLLGKFFLPFDFAKDVAFNTIGTINALGIFLACLFPAALALLFVLPRLIVKILVGFFLAFSLFILLLINFWVAWFILFMGASLVLVLGIVRGELFEISWLFLPILLLMVSLFALIFQAPVIRTLNLPGEISPSFRANLKIATETIKNGYWLFGSGPGTFVYDYSKFKPLEINQTSFWAIRFSSGPSEIIDRLATTGILGVLAILLVMVFVGLFGLKTLALGNISKKEKYLWPLLLGVFASLIGVIISFFGYSVNISLGFLFWVLMAANFSLIGEKTKDFNLRTASLIEREGSTSKTAVSLPTLFIALTFIFILITGLGIFFLQGQRYFAETNYLSGNKAIQRGDVTSSMNHLLAAIRLTGGRQDNYWRDLSQIYLFRINEELQKKDIKQQELSQTINNLAGQAINASKRATDSGPRNVSNWSVRGYIYTILSALVEGADEWAIKTYEEAIKLEPTNPYFWVEIGQTYLARADNLEGLKDKSQEREDALDKARERFQKALELKTDYATARFQLAMIDVREQKTKDAIEKLETTKTFAPLDTGLAFQLGLIYRADNQIEKAKAEFERAIILDPNYSNARYFLGLIYEEQGEKDKAIAQFKEIEKLNPENSEVKKILTNLEKGKPALEGVVPAEPPITEKSPEKLGK